MSNTSGEENSGLGVIKFAMGMGIMIVAIALTLVVVSLLQSTRKPTEKLEVRPYKQVADFQLTSQSGQEFTREALEGKVWVANFIFTSCAAECLILSQKMGDLQRHYIGNTDVAFVSISVDPHTDTPERLTTYAQKYSSDARWTFLTGPVKDVDILIKESFLLPVARTPGERSEILLSNFIHSDRLAVVDRKGVVRFYMDGMRPDAVKEISKVVNQLLAEPKAP